MFSGFLAAWLVCVSQIGSPKQNLQEDACGTKVPGSFTVRLEAVAIGLEASALRLEAIAIRRYIYHDERIFELFVER